MSEQAVSNLNTAELQKLLALLSEYIDSPHAMIATKVGVPDGSGNPVHLDGAKFCAAFVNYLKSKSEDASARLHQLSLTLEISSYLRSGGIKALLYRLETGCSIVTPDLFDSLSEQLRYQLNGNELAIAPPFTSAFLYQRLRQISPEDENCVAAALTQIDNLLLSLTKILEQISLDSIPAAVAAETATEDVGT